MVLLFQNYASIYAKVVWLYKNAISKDVLPYLTHSGQNLKREVKTEGAAQAYLEPCQISTMKLFAKIVNKFSYFRWVVIVN